MYWVVFGLFSLIETFSDYIIYGIPFYYEAKLIFLIVLQIERFKIAPTLYNTFVLPSMSKYEPKIDEFFNDLKTHGVAKIVNDVKSIPAIAKLLGNNEQDSHQRKLVKPSSQEKSNESHEPLMSTPVTENPDVYGKKKAD